MTCILSQEQAASGDTLQWVTWWNKTHNKLDALHHLGSWENASNPMKCTVVLYFASLLKASSNNSTWIAACCWVNHNFRTLCQGRSIGMALPNSVLPPGVMEKQWHVGLTQRHHCQLLHCWHFFLQQMRVFSPSFVALPGPTVLCVF